MKFKKSIHELEILELVGSKFIVLGNQKGGVGKSTTAINIAIELSKHYTVKVMDLDKAKNFTDVISTRKKNKKKVEFELIDGIHTKNDLKIWYSALDKSQNIIYIIDTGGHDSDINRLAIAISHLLISPTNTTDKEIKGMLKFIGIVDDISKKLKIKKTVTILFNRIHPNKKVKGLLSHATRLQKHGYKNMRVAFFKTTIKSKNDYDEAEVKGLSVCELGFWKSAKVEFTEFLQEIINKIAT